MKSGDFRIKCKVHDDQERVIKVGIADEKYTIAQIVDFMEKKPVPDTFYTEENNKKARVRKGVSSQGRVYLTTHPDGVTDNNLDELPEC